MSAWIAPLLGLAGNLISGKQQQNAWSTRISDTVRQAKEAGIHPLEAIRGGLAQQSRPPLMSQAAMSNTFDQIDSILTGRKAAEQKAIELRNDLMRVEIDEGRRGLASPALARTIGSPNQSPEAGRETITNPHMDHYVNPWNLDAETAEARYGDIFQEAYGVRNKFNDSWYNYWLDSHSELTGESKQQLHDRWSKMTQEQVTKEVHEAGSDFWSKTANAMREEVITHPLSPFADRKSIWEEPITESETKFLKNTTPYLIGSFGMRLNAN